MLGWLMCPPRAGLVARCLRRPVTWSYVICCYGFVAIGRIKEILDIWLPPSSWGVVFFNLSVEGRHSSTDSIYTL